MYKISDNYSIVHSEHETIILDKKNNRVLSANETAKEILFCVSKNMNHSEICNYLKSIYEISDTELVEAVEKYISQMIQLNIIISI